MGETIEFPAPGTDSGTRADEHHGAARRARPLWRDLVGEVLREERLEQERILTEVARTAGVSPQYLSEVERGRKEASSEVLGAVTDALGLGLVDVVGRVAGRLAERDARAAEAARRRVRVLDLTVAPAAPGVAPAAPAIAPWAGAAAPANAYLLAA
ncbi:helix-turn-helix domain-containing protein [Agromyces sp. ZXT2-3]|uniref:helix-turn-helix domain-containing protein n=1 Tax=Agromyces sp. ZXT2-3 TaxID=3461152 RepID=UPI004054DBC6